MLSVFEVIIALALLGSLFLAVSIYEWWDKRYHKEIYCPECGTRLNFAWYERSRKFDAYNGTGECDQEQRAFCPENTSHFYKNTRIRQKTKMASDGTWRIA